MMRNENAKSRIEVMKRKNNGFWVESIWIHRRTHTLSRLPAGSDPQAHNLPTFSKISRDLRSWRLFSSFWVLLSSANPWVLVYRIQLLISFLQTKFWLGLPVFIIFVRDWQTLSSCAKAAVKTKEPTSSEWRKVTTGHYAQMQSRI